MDPKTTNETIGCNVAANSSVAFSGGCCGLPVGNFCNARQDTKIALTPIYVRNLDILPEDRRNDSTHRTCHQRLAKYERTAELFGSPKCPENRASCHVSISGIHLYNIKRAGIRRRKRMTTRRTTSRQGTMPRAGLLKDWNCNQAPRYTKQAELSTRSMIDQKESPSTCILKSPSHEMAQPAQDDHYQNEVGRYNNIPAANAAKRSSLPMVHTIPVTRRAKDMYCVMYDSRSMNPRLYKYFIR